VASDASTATRIVITGGSGFIGTNLVEYYSRRGTHIVNLDNAAPRNTAHARYWRRTNILNLSALQRELEAFDPTHVVHLAARTDLLGRSVVDYGANVEGVRNLVAALDVAQSLRRVVFASSRLVCRIGYPPRSDTDYCPTTPYGESKAVGEQIVRSSTIAAEWTIVRPTSIWGPWFDVPYRDFFVAIASGRYVHPRGRRIYKSFGFVGNSVHQIGRVLAADGALAGETIYLGDYPPVEIYEWASLISDRTSRRPPREVPLPLLRVAAIVGDGLEKIGLTAPLTRFRLANMLTNMTYDLTPLESVAGDLPYSLDEGVEVTLRWLSEVDAPRSS
jgi:GlcNAc-P-P-Und epimerase